VDPALTALSHMDLLRVRHAPPLTASPFDWFLDPGGFCVPARNGRLCLLYLILLNFPISVAVAKELCSAARLNASRVAPGCMPRLSVLRAYSVNS
jgi:hypothetical protein